MGLGQTMLTTMFLVLLTVAAVNSYKMINDQEVNYYQEEAYKQSGILANALLQEIVRKKFDENIIVPDTLGYDSLMTKFTSYSLLGPDVTITTIFGKKYTYPYESNNVLLPDSIRPSINNEHVPRKSILYKSVSNSYYDDIDDYNNYRRYAEAGYLVGFYLDVKVYYVDTTFTKVNTPQFYKKIEVTVSNSRYLKKNLTYSTIVSY